MDFETTIGAYVVSRYDDLRSVLAAPDYFSSRHMAGPQLGQLAASLPSEQQRLLALMSSLNSADGTEHTRIRRVANQKFTPTVVRRMADGIHARVRKAFAEISGEFDFVSGLAAPLALNVIADLLEVPEADRDLFRSFAGPVLDLTNGEEVIPEVLGAYFAGMIEFCAYFRRSPLFGELPEEDRLALCLALVVAGTDSTTNLLSNLVLRLGEFGDPRDGFVEEVIRLESPFRGFFRTATADATVGGVRVRAGEHLFLDFAAGNRDEAVFDDVLDPSRPAAPPHLGFGHGAHYCLGAQLARTEARIVVGELLDHGFEVAEQPGEVRFRRHLIGHGPAALRVRPARRPG